VRNLKELLVLVIVVAAAAACGAPVKNTPIAEIPALKTLDDVMANQATIADPQMKKAGQGAYTDADYAAFAEVGARIDATSTKIKDFSKGPDFDAFALKLNGTAKALSAAAAAKDAAKSGAALAEMKATCKACHSKFK
jgi:cytochrome c556